MHISHMKTSHTHPHDEFGYQTIATSDWSVGRIRMVRGRWIGPRTAGLVLGPRHKSGLIWTRSGPDTRPPLDWSADPNHDTGPRPWTGSGGPTQAAGLDPKWSVDTRPPLDWSADPSHDTGPRPWTGSGGATQGCWTGPKTTGLVRGPGPRPWFAPSHPGRFLERKRGEETTITT